jgi:FkbM family methyltransferase
MSVFREFLKRTLKPWLIRSGLPLTRNMKYDRQAWLIMKKVLRNGDNCIDVGCHKGEFSDWMLECSPNGTHCGFEPIPDLLEGLRSKYGKRLHLFPYALGKAPGKAIFSWVKNAPAYSGLKRRNYLVEKPEIVEIEVEVKRIDDLAGSEIPDQIRLIKIDVEGGELDVIAGAERLITKCKPFILFEFGLGSAEYYDARPETMFAQLSKMGLSVYTLSDFLKQKQPLSAEEFSLHFKNGSEYYFLAAGK